MVPPLLAFFPFCKAPILSAVLIGWAAMFVVVKRVLAKRDGRCRGRKMSIMTELMVAGSFPESAGEVNYAITIPCYMKKLPELEAVKKAYSKLFSCYNRFRSVPQLPYWREVGINIDDHVHYFEVENQRELDEQVEVIMNRPLPADKPRWEVIIIRNREVDKTASSYVPSPTVRTSPPYHTLLNRVDHSIGDGIALVEVLAKFLTDFDGRPVVESGLVGLNRSPPKVIKGIPVTMNSAMGAYDTETSFTATMDEKKRGLVFSRKQKLAAAGPWSLEYVKLIKNKLGISLNDVFMSAFAGAIRRYCIEEGDTEFSTAKSRVLCRTLLPFAFLRDHTVFDNPEAALSNDWTLISAELAVNEAKRINRAMATNRIMAAIKRKLRPLSSVLVRSIGCRLLPARFFKQTVHDSYNRHSVVFANVPGPVGKVRICGCVIEEFQVLFCGLLPQVELFTYAGGVFFVLVADPKIIAHPNKIVQYFKDELRDLGKELGITTHSLEFKGGDERPDKTLLSDSEMSFSSSSQ